MFLIVLTSFSHECRESLNPSISQIPQPPASIQLYDYAWFAVQAHWPCDISHIPPCHYASHLCIVISVIHLHIPVNQYGFLGICAEIGNLLENLPPSFLSTAVPVRKPYSKYLPIYNLALTTLNLSLLSNFTDTSSSFTMISAGVRYSIRERQIQF